MSVTSLPLKHDEQIRRAVQDLVQCARARDARLSPLSRIVTSDVTVQRRLATGCTGVIRGWQVIVSVVTYAEDEVREWHASAMLYPRGRLSSDSDWAALGRMIAASGAPAEAMQQITAQAATVHPNRPQHWHWTER